MADGQETIAAVATPRGLGGIGIVRLSGPKSLSISQAITGTSPPKNRTLCYASFKDSKQQVIDKGIVIYFKQPASFTGEDIIELHGHGGPVVMDMLLKRCLELGARQARPGEFTERAYLNDKLDLLQAEAIADLINSSSEQAARSAIRSLDGEFSRRVNELNNELISLRSYVEGALDFPEEEIDFLANPELRNRIEGWLTDLQHLLDSAEQGRVLAEGLRVVILGRPNVGKSSLLNRLTQTDRAIVTDTPGTTRDVIEDNILVHGMPINIVDTAGIRDDSGNIEKEGIRRALKASETADLILLVIQAQEDYAQELQGLLEQAPERPEKLILVNKIDLIKQEAISEKTERGTKKIFLSAKTGEGLDLLLQELEAIAGLKDHGENTLLARTRHVQALQEAHRIMSYGITDYQRSKAGELLAEEMSRTHKILGSITGEFASDDLLGEIFSRFCIGK